MSFVCHLECLLCGPLICSPVLFVCLSFGAALAKLFVRPLGRVFSVGVFVWFIPQSDFCLVCSCVFFGCQKAYVGSPANQGIRF